MTIAYDHAGVTIHHGDALTVLAGLPSGSVQTCITSPPYYGLRSYLAAAHADKPRELGLERSPAEYVAGLVGVFREVKRVLRDDGTLWLNLGDSYAANPSGGLTGSTLTKGGEQTPHTRGIDRGRFDVKPKDLLGIPWRVAFALQDDGWWLRSDIIWSKNNPMPESVADRPTKAHEYLFLLSKRATYFYDGEAIKEPYVIGDGGRQRAALRGLTPYADASRAWKEAQVGNGHDGLTKQTYANGRNRRSVWTIPTQPFTGWTKSVRRVRVEPGDADGDTRRITSPDCPVHGSARRRVATGFGDGHAAGSSSRTGHSDGHPGRAPVFGSAPTAPRPAANSAARSSDLLPLLNGLSATGHSTESRRTAPVPATTPPCTPSDETPDDTERTPAPPASVALHPDTPANNTSPDATDVHSPGRTSSRTLGKSSHVPPECTCELYREITEETSHFAVFPEKLVEPCILAGSRRGDIILDPFCGSGTTLAVAKRLGRHAVGVELNAAYLDLATARLRQDVLPLAVD